MLNADLCFDADMRKMQCGLNAVIYFVGMDKTEKKGNSSNSSALLNKEISFEVVLSNMVMYFVEMDKTEIKGDDNRAIAKCGTGY